MAWDMGLTLAEAAEYVVPVATSAKEQIQRLRTQATGRFISASHPGLYTAEDHQVETPVAAPKARSYAMQD
jgi:hypothetical protein